MVTVVPTRRSAGVKQSSGRSRAWPGRPPPTRPLGSGPRFLRAGRRVRRG